MIRPNRRLPLWWQRVLRMLCAPESCWYAARDFDLALKNAIRDRERRRALARGLFPPPRLDDPDNAR